MIVIVSFAFAILEKKKMVVDYICSETCNLPPPCVCVCVCINLLVVFQGLGLCLCGSVSVFVLV